MKGVLAQRMQDLQNQLESERTSFEQRLKVAQEALEEADRKRESEIKQMRAKHEQAMEEERAQATRKLMAAKEEY